MRRSPAALLAIAAVVWIAVSGAPASASVSVVMPTYPYITDPYVPLNTDPGDAEGPVAEQDVVFQCDPAWGPEECPIEGIDFRNVEASVLLQNYPELAFTARSLLQPGVRPVPTYGPCPQPGQVGYCPGGLYYPSNQFQSEMAALSWNFLMVLIAYQQPADPENPGLGDLDPNDPQSHAPNQCSFAQPQYCSSVIAALPEAGAALAMLTALLALGALPRRRSS